MEPLLDDDDGDRGDAIRMQSVTGERGLTQEEANERFQEHGPNALHVKRPPLALRALLIVIKPISLFLVAVMVVSGVLMDWATVAVVGLLLVLNVVFVLVEEVQAEKAVDALRKRLGLETFVLRSSQWMLVPNEILVPGDIIKLKLGDLVPADCVLQQGKPLEVDQSSVTGESLPVHRGPGERVHSGSIVVSGAMTALVVATGRNSMLGTSMDLMEVPKQTTRLQAFVFRIALILTFVSFALCGTLVTVKFLQGAGPPLLVVQHAMVLLVASLPIALALMVTTALALGSRELVRVGIITARLNAIEQLAGMDVALCDKTGTLTANKLKLVDPWLNDGVSESDLLMWAALASSTEAPDAIDRVIGRKLRSRSTLARYFVLDFTPFDPLTKRSSAVVRELSSGSRFEVVKGAPATLLEALPMEGGAALTDKVTQVVREFGARGVRSLGVAVRNLADANARFRYLGLLAMFDALRPEARETVHEMASEGVEVKMVTGDGLDIGRETCRQLGMHTQGVGREQLVAALASGDTDALVDADVFGEVLPEDKFDIVGLLQSRGHIVGMTGDGVNDCPALRRADIGIAVAGSTDAARVAADVVLTRSDMTVLLDAVAISRMIFERVRNYILFRINCTCVILFWSFLAGVALNFAFPALVLIIIAWFNNFVVLAVAYDHIVPQHEPVVWNYRDVLPHAFCTSVLSCCEVYTTFVLAQGGYLLFTPFMTPAQWRTAVFLTLCLSDQFSVLVMRAHHFVLLSTRPGLGLLLAVFGTCVAASACAAWWPFGSGLEPVSMLDVGQCWLIMLFFFALKDLAKVLITFVVGQLFFHARGPAVPKLALKQREQHRAHRERGAALL